MEHYSLTSNNYTIRTEMHQSRNHIVVPVVMMVEGVHSGSHGPILHLAEELAKFPGSWNGIPVSIQHPEENGFAISANHPEIIDSQVVGRVYNAIMEDGKLKAEAWIDEEVINRVSPEALSYLLQSRPLDVSVGVFNDDDQTSGDWNGEQYEGVARNYRPDHLALLPGGRGACSWVDGCGVRVNAELEVPKMLKFVKGEHPNVKELAAEGFSISINEMSHQEMAGQIQAKLDRMDDDQKVHFLVECYDDHFIYRINFRNPGTVSQPSSIAEGDLYRRDYKVNEKDEIEFTGEAVPVVKKTEYVTMANRGGTNMAENKNTDNKGCCPEKVELLIQNERTRFTDSDREWLLGLNEDQVEKLVPVEPATKSHEDPPQMNREEAIQVLKDELGDQQKFMALLPQELREQIDFGLRAYRARRKEMTDLVLASAPEVFTVEELGGKSMEELEKLVRLAKPKGDFTPLAPAIHSSESEMLLPQGVQ